MQPVYVGDPGVALSNSIECDYILVTPFNSAELSVTALDREAGEYRVRGLGLWGLQTGVPRTGELDFVANLLGDDRIEHWEVFGGQINRVALKFSGHLLSVEESGQNPNAGTSVRFGGNYARSQRPQDLPRGTGPQ